MSYRCGKCKNVCNHSQIRVVTETRERRHPPGARETAKEMAVCEPCAADLKINVFNVRHTDGVNGQVYTDDSESSSVMVGSA